jgi:hypothetical protein
MKGDLLLMKGVTYKGRDGLLALLTKEVIPENIKILPKT